jgi:hypothetical protein
MGAPHNTKRYGETWDPEHLAVMSAEIEALRDLCTVSGGWAWHYMTPPHTELKHAHDHKDADLFVAPASVWEMMARLQERGYERTWTRFDGQSDDFHRYTKIVQGTTTFKVILDIFTGDVPSVMTPSGIRVVEPRHLLSLYGVKHSSVQCFAVQTATRLVAASIDPVGHAEMADYRPFLKGLAP